MPQNVFHGGRYIGYIKNFKRNIFSEEKLSPVVDVLHRQRLEKSWATNREYIDSLHERKGSATIYKSNPKIICRQCSYVMVERRNKKSQESFLGV